MPESQPQSANAPVSGRAPDWEAFYRDYRKPGYVPGFEITTKLGGGMSGLVYRARKQSIGKDYAIKFLQVDDGEVARAVLAELEQVRYFAQIDHPNLVSIEDRGEVDGIPYLVMAFAGTETLRDRMPGDGQPPEGAAKQELLSWFLQCCRGLSALHERSLVHFDVKPANVFLKGPVARLGDYGLSKLVTHSRGSLSMGRGTPYYLAPEMLERRGDHRSDVYSAGVMLYELLCGKVPFAGSSEWEVLKQHAHAEPQWPAHLNTVERSVLARCLAKDPAARFQSVHDLIAAFGSTPAVGAAAWSEVRAGLSVPPPAPARMPPPAPPPLPPASRLAEEAKRHAQQIAEQAVRGARDAARSASNAMRKTMAEVRRATKAHHRRQFAHLRTRVHWPWRRRRAAEPRRRSGLGTALGVIGAVAMALVALGVFALYLGVRSASPVAVSFESRPVPSEPVRSPSPADLVQTFARYDVPSHYRGLVSTFEPHWVALAEHDPTAAAVVLEERFQRLRTLVPFTPEARADAPAWPMFGDLRRAPRAQAEPFDRFLARLDRLAVAGDVDGDLVAQTIALGPVALGTVAQRLGGIGYASRSEVRHAQRLHELLERATGCREIEFVEAPTPAATARRNRALGPIWCWFVNEIAHTDRTWRTYRRLRGG